MKRALATVLIVAACIAVWLDLPSLAVASPPAARQVVIIVSPYLSWSDITPTATPAIWTMVENGAIGDVNAQSRSREPGEAASPLEGALTISAGSWAMHTGKAPAAYNANERYEVGNAADAFERMTGQSVEDEAVLFLGLPMTERANERSSFEVVLGALGDAVRQAGGVTAAIGNSDIGYETNEPRRLRPAALAAMDRRGMVQYGDVSRRLLTENPDAPFGIQTDLEIFERTLDAVAEEIDGHKGPALVVLDSGELYRATKFSPQVTEGVGEKQRSEALRSLDSVTEMARERFPQAVVMVVSQSTGDPTLGESEGLGPVIVSGSGWSGLLTSNSTHRTGLVTNPDVSATVLDVLGLKPPVEMIGNQMRPIANGQPAAEKVARLAGMDAAAVAVEQSRRGVINAFVAVTVLVLALAALVLTRARLWSQRVRAGWQRVLRAALLLVAVVPAASWLMFSWMPTPATPLAAVIAISLTSLVLWAAALALWWRTPSRLPLAAASLGAAAVILVDQWLGAPASFTNMFGYSPLQAARFYGMGNESAAIAFGAAIVGIALLLDEWRGTAVSAWMRRFGLPILGVLVVFTAAAPFLGANIGVAIWGVVGFGLAWVLMNDRRVSWHLVLWLALAAGLLIAAFAGIDLLAGTQQTHLGRSLMSAREGGLGELWTIVARKAETNVRVLTHTNWAYILIATLGFLAFMRWRPQGNFAAVLEDNPAFADAITVSLVVALVAYFTEDSGIVISALVVFYVGVALAWLMLARMPVAIPEEEYEEILP